MIVDTTGRVPLAGLRVLDLSTRPAGAVATQFLADAGADVLMVEPPAGSSVRTLPGWPALGRGKRSTMLDLDDPGARARLDALIADADVLVMTYPPAVAARIGFSAEALAALNPRLVSLSITAWGSTGPWSHYPDDEALVMAKLGYLHAKAKITARPGPAYVSVPYARWGAAQTGIHGLLAALIERERSGLGQHVESDLVRGVNTIDTWSWFTELVAARWPDAYEAIDAFNEKGELQGHLVYPLLIAPTKDGHWLQFAQTQARLFVAMLEEFGLSALWSDPKWAGLPILPTQELRTELWEVMLGKVAERTLAEWLEVRDSNPSIGFELFRAGPAVFDHPQLVHDGRSVVVSHPELGPVRQPSTLVHEDGHPLRPIGVSPVLGADDAQFVPRSPEQSTASPPRTAPTLAGITVLDFGVMFAGPFGSTLLSDFGARVIKVESTAGDAIRTILPFPESGGAKVMMGKESICVDITTPEGADVVRRLIARADVVLQAFRAGAADRAGIGSAVAHELNPDLVYVNAPGYGIDGPFGNTPAYAPSIGAAGGLALTDAPDATDATGSLDEVKWGAMTLMNASAIAPLQADGLSALGVASTILLGLLARSRGRPMGDLTATMLGTATHALVDQLIDYEGCARGPKLDAGKHGLGALYRLYPASSGWVFLAAREPGEWDTLMTGLGGLAHFAAKPSFATAAGRAEHDEALAAELGAIFAARPADDWERLLVPLGVGCVAVTEGSPQRLLQTHEAAAATYTSVVTSAMFDEHPRPDSTVRFSRSETTLKGFVTAGHHTDAILDELGYSAEKIQQLRDHKVVA